MTVDPPDVCTPNLGKEIRQVVADDGSTWYVARDVAADLGISWSGARCLRMIPESFVKVEPYATKKGDRPTHFLSEPGIYLLASRSRSQAARKYQSRILSELIPGQEIASQDPEWRAQLDRAGIADHWRDVAEAIGPDAFMVMMAVLKDSTALDDRGRVHLPSVLRLRRLQRDHMYVTLESQIGSEAAAEVTASALGFSARSLRRGRYMRRVKKEMGDV